DRLQLAEELVVLRIGDLRGRLVVVEAVVALDLTPQLLRPRFRLLTHALRCVPKWKHGVHGVSRSKALSWDFAASQPARAHTQNSIYSVQLRVLRVSAWLFVSGRGAARAGCRGQRRAPACRPRPSPPCGGWRRGPARSAACAYRRLPRRRARRRTPARLAPF